MANELHLNVKEPIKYFLINVEKFAKCRKEREISLANK
jgi:hypothetical protein